MKKGGFTSPPISKNFIDEVRRSAKAYDITIMKGVYLCLCYLKETKSKKVGEQKLQELSNFFTEIFGFKKERLGKVLKDYTFDSNLGVVKLIIDANGQSEEMEVKKSKGKSKGV